MDPISIGIAALAAGATAVGAAAAVGSLAYNVVKDNKDEQRSATQTQSNQAAPYYNSYPVPQAENVAHHYGTSGTGRVTIGSDGRSISAGGSAPGDLTFGYSTRTIAYSSPAPGSRPTPTFTHNQPQTLPPQIPFFLMPPPQQQQGGFIQQSQYSGSRPAANHGDYNGGQRVIEYAPDGRNAAASDSVRRARSFRR